MRAYHRLTRRRESIAPRHPPQPLGLKVLRLLWTCGCLVLAVLHTLCFASADWLVATDVHGFRRIRLGPAFACLERQSLTAGQGDEECGAYGLALSDIPHMSWQAACFFLGLAAIVLWLLVLISPAALFNRRVGKTSAIFMGIAGTVDGAWRTWGHTAEAGVGRRCSTHTRARRHGETIR